MSRTGYRLYRNCYKNRQGHKQKAAKWYAEFRDHLQTVRRLALFTDKAASEEAARNLVKLVQYHVGTGGQVEPSLTKWLAGLPNAMKAKLAKCGLIPKERYWAARPLTEHLEDFRHHLETKGNSSFHVDTVHGRAERIITGCGFRYYADLSAHKIASWLHAQRKDTKEKRGLSAQTFNFYVQAIGQFCRWMVREGRAVENPLAKLAKLNVRTDRRRDRRALSPEEQIKLFNAAMKAPTRGGMSGPDRALLYLFCLETGLRMNEVRSLTRSSFKLDNAQPTVVVLAAYSKHRREDELPLRPALVPLLVKHLAQLQPNEPAFNVHQDRKVVGKAFEADLADAGIAYRDQQGRIASFHAMRHSFITNLARAGIAPKTAMDLSRHGSINLTMNFYSHIELHERAKALDKVPGLLVDKADCWALSNGPVETHGDSNGLTDIWDGSTDNEVLAAENTGNTGNNASGSVWESNPLGALFKPPTGFEDQGHHQVCKHSRRVLG